MGRWLIRNANRSTIVTMTNLLLRFALLYPLALIAAGIVVHVLGLGAGGPAVNIAILFGLVAFLADRFAKRNGRYLTPQEFRRAFFGLLALNLLYQVLVGLVAAGRLQQVNLSALSLSLALAALLHGLAIYLALRVMRKNLEKRGVIPAKGSGPTA